jgi:hypothetical protein
MRLLFAIPHFFDPAPKDRRHGSLSGDPRPRIASLAHCLAGLKQQFGRPQAVIDIARRTTTPANQTTAVQLDVVVCTTGSHHLLGRLPLGSGYFTHHDTGAEPKLLGYECHAVLRDRLGAYDYYCYLEDDLLIRDPWLFVKLRWFCREFGDDALLMPNRYELARDRIVHKAYVDGPLRPDVTAGFQNVDDKPTLEAEPFGQRVVFRRALNPHSGAFFLNARQMEAWAAKPYFLDRDTWFVGPLESAATLGVMRTFRIYKPAQETAGFLEIEHPGTAFLSRIRLPRPGGNTSRGA